MLYLVSSDIGIKGSAIQGSVCGTNCVCPRQNSNAIVTKVCLCRQIRIFVGKGFSGVDEIA
jgi:hypothetical protein